MTVFVCDDSTDGIFSGVYDAWDSRVGHDQVRLEVGEGMNFQLFADYREIPVDSIKAEKVARTVRNRMGEEDYYHIYHATLSKEKEKADCIYHTIVEGLKGGGSRSVMQYLQNDAVRGVFEMSRNIQNEAHRYLQFVRFRELENGVLFSEIKPENQVLPLIGEHFADRFPGEHFMIYDITHCVFLVHEAHRQWALVRGEQPNRELTQRVSGQEKDYQELWKGFCRTIGIQERRNLRLQQQFLPKKFRKYMTENFD